jgi:putative SOS response-associated peptidase YedK
LHESQSRQSATLLASDRIPHCVGSVRGVTVSMVRIDILRLVCERYVIPEQSEVEREFRVARPWWQFTASFNVAAGKPVPVLRQHEGSLEGVMLHWGMIPEWAEGDGTKACAAHVSAERVAHDPITRGAWVARRRCILPASGFYMWRLTPMRYRQPYFVRALNRATFGIAALWDRTVQEDEDDVIESCTILSVTSLSSLSQASGLAVPAILQRDDYERWLDTDSPAAEALLAAAARQPLQAHAISPRITSLAYDDAGLIRSVESHQRLSA